MDRSPVRDDRDAPATAGVLPCTTFTAGQGVDGHGVPLARRREDLLRHLELQALAELQRLAAARQRPADSPDLLASFIEWDLAVGG